VFFHLHAALDGVSWEVLEKRQKYYEALFPLMLKILDVNTKRLEFVKGSELQLNPKYFEDVLKMSMLSSVREAIRTVGKVEARESRNGIEEKKKSKKSLMMHGGNERIPAPTTNGSGIRLEKYS